MAYVNKDGETRLVVGERVILQEEHKGFFGHFLKGEECEIKYAMDNGANSYCIVSLDGKKLVDFVHLGGLADNSIVITNEIPTEAPIEKDKGNELGASIVKQMFRFMEA